MFRSLFCSSLRRSAGVSAAGAVARTVGTARLISTSLTASSATANASGTRFSSQPTQSTTSSIRKPSARSLPLPSHVFMYRYPPDFESLPPADNQARTVTETQWGPPKYPNGVNGQQYLIKLCYPIDNGFDIEFNYKEIICNTDMTIQSLRQSISELYPQVTQIQITNNNQKVADEQTVKSLIGCKSVQFHLDHLILPANPSVGIRDGIESRVHAFRHWFLLLPLLAIALWSVVEENGAQEKFEEDWSKSARQHLAQIDPAMIEKEQKALERRNKMT